MAGIEQFTEEYFARQRVNLAKPLPSGQASFQIQDQNFAQNVWDEVTVQPFWNMLAQSADVFQKYDPDFDPLSPENLKGFEQYSGVLREARNAEHASAIKDRITRFAETKTRIDEEGGILSGFVSEIFNPINYLIPGAPLRRGVGVASGFARGVAAGAPGQIVDEALRQRVDPTATLMESGSNLAYGMVFAGLIGSGIGFMKAPDGSQIVPDVNGIAKKYEEDMARYRGEEVSTVSETSIVSPLPVPKGLTETAGWKFHIGIDSLAVDKDAFTKKLNDLGVQFKEGLNSGQTGKDFTIYLGSKDYADSIAKELSPFVQGKIYGDTLIDDIEFAPGIGGRFDANGDVTFHQYGKFGIPILKDLVRIGEEIKFRDEDIKFSETVLANKYGEFFTGKKSTVPTKAAVVKKEPEFATGVYKLADSLSGIVRINSYGDLITSGVGHWETFGHRMLGEMDLILNKNKLDKLPTEASLYLGNGMNIGVGVDYRDRLNSLFGEYLGGGLDQMTVAGLNVPVTGRRIADAARGMVGTRASDGLMTYPEFKDMIYRSLRDDGSIVVPDKRADGTVIAERERNVIEKGAEQTAAFYRTLGERFTEAGYLRTKQGAIKQLDLHKNALKEHQDRLAVLYGIDNPTAKQLVEMEVRQDAITAIGEKISEFNKFGIRDEDFYQEKIKDIALTKKAAQVRAGEKLDKLREDIADRRSTMQAELDDLLDKDPADIRPSDLRRMSYLEQRLGEGISEKQQAFIKNLETRTKKKYSNRQADYLYYLMQKEEEIAQIRKDIDEDVISYENLRKNYVSIIYDIDAILADEAGPQIFRKKVEAKFKEDSERNGYKREKKDSVYELGREKASIFVDANDLETIYKKIDELETKQRGLREALSPEDLQKIIDEQRRIRNAIADRMKKEESSLTPEEIKLASKEERAIDLESLKMRLAKLMGQEEFNLKSSSEQAADIQWNIHQRVNQTMNNILRQGELGELSVGTSGGASFMARRKLGFSPHEIADFTITDVEALSIAYASRAGMASQVTKAYGSRDATIGIYKALADGIDDLKGNDFNSLMEQVTKAKNSMDDVRDYALGDQWAKDVTAWDRKAVRAILDASTVNLLDNAAVPSIADAVRPITTFGVSRTMEFAFKGMFSDLDALKNMSAELKLLTGEFGEVSGAAAAHTYVNGGGVSSAGTNWATKSLDKFSGFANGPFFILNGLSILTEVLKKWTGLMSAHFMIEDAGKIANKTADEKTLTNWLASGMSEEDAIKIAKLTADGIIERPNYGYYANTSKWNDDDLVTKFAIANRAQIRRTIVTSGPANKPTIAQGFIGQGDERREIALARLPFQLMSWAFAANNKIMLSALQGRDANVFGTALTLVGMGGIVSYLTTPAGIWDKLTLEEKMLRSTERSGIFGIFTDTSSIVETATRGHYGIRPMLGMDPPYGEVDGYRQFTRIAGAPTSNFVELYKIFVDQDLTDRERAKSVINLIPLTGAFYWKEGWQQLGKSAADAWD